MVLENILNLRIRSTLYILSLVVQCVSAGFYRNLYKLYLFIHTYMYTITKKDILAFNQQAGETGEFSNESSLDFALSIAKTKQNWLYELSYLARSLLVDHVFRDGNKRTCLLVLVYFFEQNKQDYDRAKLLSLMKKIAKNNITHPLMIMRLIHNVTQEENKTVSREK